MNVTFNPSVNFNSETNLIAEAARKMKEAEASKPAIPSSEPLPKEQADTFEREFKEILKEEKSIETILNGKHWEKVYDPGSNTVHAKIPNSYDGNEYTIYPDGKVVVTNGWGRNEVEREANKELADYIKQRKAEYEDAIHRGFEKKFGTEQAAREPKSNTYTSREYTQAELDEKAGIFAQRLKSRKWKKEYLPENDIIMVRNKRMKDGLEYMIKNDGTVMETGLRDKAVVIIEPSRESAKTFAKYKKKLDPDAPKTSLWMKGKEAVANVWKFFTVAGTMGIATAKGLWQGALTGAGVLAVAAVARGTVKAIKNEGKFLDIIKTPLKAAGTSGKLIAAAAGALVLTGHLIAGKLEANQKSSVIEHKIDVPHENN